MNLKNLWREPLLHFLIVGVALFYIFDLRQGEQSEAPNRIVVDGTQIQQLTEKFKRTWLRTPTQVELDGLIENHIREEVFYREALAMGLDQGDPLVKNRLKTKLEYMLEELSAVEASEEELTAFLNKH
ncbi:MAG: peptidyl-prolyl cis-trans isomerase, partial [Gammaproteobacteria bacterium]